MGHCVVSPKCWAHGISLSLRGIIAGQIYEIYKQDIDAADMYTHLQRWKQFLEKLLSRKLAGQDEFIFPTIGSNGVVYPKQMMSYDTVQEYINQFQDKAGLTSGKLTTHSFRRGGAQYRFMYAPLGQRWTLSRIRWWGGWAKAENVRTHSISSRLSSESLMHGGNRSTP